MGCGRRESVTNTCVGVRDWQNKPRVVLGHALRHRIAQQFAHVKDYDSANIYVRNRQNAQKTWRPPPCLHSVSVIRRHLNQWRSPGRQYAYRNGRAGEQISCFPVKNFKHKIYKISLTVWLSLENVRKNQQN